MDTVAHIILFIANPDALIGAFIVVGFIVGNKDKVGRIALLLFFSLIFNAFLKSLFQEPLASHIQHSGWSHPSGHMQTAIVIYGALCWEFRKKWLYLIMVLLMPLAAWGMLHFRYHTLDHIVGGVLAGIGTLVLFYGLTTRTILRDKSLLLGLMLMFITAPMLVYFCAVSQYAFYVDRWIYWGMIGGFALGWQWVRLNSSRDLMMPLLSKALATVGACAGVGLLYFKSTIVLNYLPTVLGYIIQGLMVGFWASAGGYLCVMLYQLLLGKRQPKQTKATICV